MSVVGLTGEIPWCGVGRPDPEPGEKELAFGLFAELDKLAPVEGGYPDTVALWVCVEGKGLFPRDIESDDSDCHWYGILAKRWGECLRLVVNGLYLYDWQNSYYYQRDICYTEILRRLTDGVRQSIEWQKDGSYDERVSTIPHRHRKGYISRRDFWDIYPEYREHFYGRSTPELRLELLEFIERDRGGINDYIPQMTANDYYDLAVECYKALGLCDDEEYMSFRSIPMDPPPTARELFYGFRYTEDYELEKIDDNDPEQFKQWVKNWNPWYKFNIVDPLLELEPEYTDGKGYQLELFDPSYMDAAISYVTLRKQGVPVKLRLADKIERELLETDHISFVADDSEIYGSGESYFPGVVFGDVTTLSSLPKDERRERVIAAATWRDPSPSSRLK